MGVGQSFARPAARKRRPTSVLPVTLDLPSPMTRFLPSLPELTVTAVIDILVVAFLVYQALMVVRGTRAGHILIGILIMVVLYG